MDYLKIYNALIDKRKIDPLQKGVTGYCELHHVVPRSFGGDDFGDNLVNLTAREHYIAHCLLWKIYSKYDISLRKNAMRLAVRQLFHSRGCGRNSILRRQRYFRCNHYLYSRIVNNESYWGKKYRCDIPC